MAADEGERKDEEGVSDTHLEYAEVTDGVTIWEDEKEGDHQVGEGGPIDALGDEGIGFVCCSEPFTNFENPVSNA